MNSVVLIGRLARDPELRFTASGKAVATFSIAVNRPFSKTNEADFFNIVVWGKPAENCANYLAKGRLVGIEGRLQSRSYESQAGEKKYVTEIVANQVEFLEWGNKENKTNNNNSSDRVDEFGSVDIDLDDFQAIDEEDGVPF
ncbi:single-stranded DNA-binding protein [Clostridium formicaceticum]|uniref:Single-stranded DNA-binding protein n=1 Tax=Clostridium formicaceticum TaxID=1497 RepID=A0AAC9WEF6_9CLOT|nr:single-stranded DNA-binding protein [Clostridium formicaceticum]AOY75437.1 single-stranded DNA-binding protein [Clostridium formicaceticum]ARE85722.1 Single-stranded DNA-binding protein ssb [Clostridium formicaceticum]